MRGRTKIYSEEERILRLKFQVQRTHAAIRGIGWNLTYETWYKIWIDSEHLKDRGCRKGQYCMSRYNDIGPYSEDNVFIQLIQQNTIEKNIKETGKKRSQEGKNRMSIAQVQRRKQEKEAVL